VKTTVGPKVTPRDPVSESSPAVEVSPVAWVPKQLPLPMGDWIRYGKRFGAFGRACGWWIGDWINVGNAVYGEKYSRAARITRLDAQTLMNMAYVASRFAFSRRRENVSWSHHAELAALPPEAQDVWLDRIETDSLTVQDLRLELRRTRSAAHKAGAEVDPAARLELALDDADANHQLVCPNCGHVYTV
jgi:hypothetical protein